MIKVDIISGFLGAGKTTLIKKLLNGGYQNEKLVLIENDFGQITIDSSFLKDSGVNVTEINSGCICCSLVGDFSKALLKVIDEFSPERIIIEPSGVGKLSDIVTAIKNTSEDLFLNILAVVVDANKFDVYRKHYGEFYNDQLENASTVIISRAKTQEKSKLDSLVEKIQEVNSKAQIVINAMDEVSPAELLRICESKASLKDGLEELLKTSHEHHHHDEHCNCGEHHHHHDDHCHHEEHHHEHDEHCSCGEHHHHHDEHCHHEEHHHKHDEHCSCGEHHHHHDEHCHHEEHHHKHDEHCHCGEHHHDHHHAEEIFTTWSCHTTKVFSKTELEAIVQGLNNSFEYGTVIRAKGVVCSENGKWLHFDFVPGEVSVREGSPEGIGALCVIGTKIHKKTLEKVFK